VTDSPPPLPPPPSWKRPIVLGATATFLLHVPLLVEHALWLPALATLGASGLLVGLVLALFALRREPGMGSAAGFALCFQSVGLGAVVLAAVTLLQGFEIPVETERLLREELVAGGQEPAAVDEMLDALHGPAGPTMVVVVASLMACAAGLSGALAAALAVRRLRRLAQSAAAPPAAP
jgi:hypothetical protein